MDTSRYVNDDASGLTHFIPVEDRSRLVAVLSTVSSYKHPTPPLAPSCCMCTDFRRGKPRVHTDRQLQENKTVSSCRHRSLTEPQEPQVLVSPWIPAPHFGQVAS